MVCKRSNHYFTVCLFLNGLATADNIHQAQFALDVKADVLPLYEKIFDVPYPLPKLDTLVVSLCQCERLIFSFKLV
jgi:hypothetical protein